MFIIAEGVRLRTINGRQRLAQCNLKLPYKGFEISVAFDDSCGTMAILGRVDARVYRTSNDEDVTDYIRFKKQHTIAINSLEDLLWVQRRIDRAIRLGLI